MREEVGVVHSLIVGLNQIAAKRCKILRPRSGSVIDDDGWFWGSQEPCYETLVRDVCRELEPVDIDQSRLLDRRRRRVVSFQNTQDVDYLLHVSEQTGRALDSDDMIRQIAGGDQILFDWYVKVARLVRSCLTQVRKWDGMIVEPVPFDLCGLHVPAVMGALGALIPV